MINARQRAGGARTAHGTDSTRHSTHHGDLSDELLLFGREGHAASAAAVQRQARLRSGGLHNLGVAHVQLVVQNHGGPVCEAQEEETAEALRQQTHDGAEHPKHTYQSLEPESPDGGIKIKTARGGQERSALHAIQSVEPTSVEVSQGGGGRFQVLAANRHVKQTHLQ